MDSVWLHVYVFQKEADRFNVCECGLVFVRVQSPRIEPLHRLHRTVLTAQKQKHYTSTVGVFAPNNTEKACATDQSDRITQGDITE